MICLLYPTNGYSQVFNIDKVVELTTDISAQRYSRFDLNDDKCALVKVQCVLPDMEFVGNVVDSVQYRGGEYWVYLVDGTKKLTCKHPNVQPLKIDFTEYLQSPLEGGHTYQVSLGIPETLYALTINADKMSEDLAKMDADSLYAKAKRLFDAKQYSESLPYVREGLERDDAQVQNLYGVMLQYGLGVQKDSINAVSYYRKAADKGLPKAQTNLGRIYASQKRFGEAVVWYKLAAEQDFSDAQFMLASCYMVGQGVPHDEKEAVRWLLPAAEAGVAIAQAALGGCYYLGKGIEQDYEKAEYWLKKGVAQGNPKAVEIYTLMKVTDDLRKDHKGK